jgi:hypothetical protein
MGSSISTFLSPCISLFSLSFGADALDPERNCARPWPQQAFLLRRLLRDTQSDWQGLEGLAEDGLQKLWILRQEGEKVA